MLEKKSSIITKAIISIVFVSMIIMPISVTADNSVSMLDWGVACAPDGGGDYQISTPNETGGYLKYYNYFGISCKSGYTYTYQDTFEFKSNNTLTLANNKLYYANDIVSSGYGNFSGNTDKALITLQKVSDNGSSKTWRLKVVFNVDTCGLLATDYYFFTLINKNTYTNVQIGNETISCYYDPGGSGYQQELVNAIADMKNQDTEFYSNALQVLDNIKSGVDSTNTKLEDMPQKIEEVLDKQANEEKTEATNKGNDVVKQATEALQNVIPYTSLLDAIQPIKQAASYTGTVSVWTLPSITIPKISGVMEETEIMSEKSFDLVSYADQFIPDTLLSVIRAVNTVGLILFAVYEVIRLVLWVVSSDSEGSGIFK